MNKEDRDWAVTRLSDLQKIRTINYQTRLVVAFKRGIALAIDCTLLLFLTATPFLFCLIIRALSGLTGDNQPFAPVSSTFFTALLATPFPLIYLHFFFKNYLYHLTPGQALAGIAYSPKDKSCTSLWRAIKCGLARYMTAVVVAFFACSLAGYCGKEWGDASIPRAIFFVCGSFLFCLTMAHFSLSNKDLRSPIDRMFAMNVTVLKRKEKGNKTRAKLTASKATDLRLVQK